MEHMKDKRGQKDGAEIWNQKVSERRCAKNNNTFDV